MTKRTFGKFTKRKQDAYYTPANAVEPLQLHLDSHRYIEPCWGDGAIPRAIGVDPVYAYDINGNAPDGDMDATTTMYATFGTDYFITNPPWTRDILHPLMTNLMDGERRERV